MDTRKTKTTMIIWTLPLADPHPPSSPLSKFGNQIISGAKPKGEGEEGS